MATKNDRMAEQKPENKKEATIFTTHSTNQLHTTKNVPPPKTPPPRYNTRLLFPPPYYLLTADRHCSPHPRALVVSLSPAAVLSRAAVISPAAVLSPLERFPNVPRRRRSRRQRRRGRTRLLRVAACGSTPLGRRAQAERVRSHDLCASTRDARASASASAREIRRSSTRKNRGEKRRAF